MPHLHLETSADVPENSDIPDILEALCREMAEIPDVDPHHLRAYHSLRSVWVMGQGSKQSFVHLSIFVLSGRDLIWKKNVVSRIMEVLKLGFAGTVDAKEANLTIDLREMTRETYARFPE